MDRTEGSNNRIQKIMIAAAASGSGKTVITCGLLEALKRRGYDPVSFKCGPDYIDPMFHRLVLGIESQNLDTYLAGANGVKAVVEEALKDAGDKGNGIAVMEGVMGIYDGMSPDSVKGSCYEIAEITHTPIILTVNAQGVGRTVISLIKGILADDGEHLIKGIILNRMSESYYDKILPHLRDEIAALRDDVYIIGHIPKSDDMQLLSRHLGLILPGESDDIKQKVGKITDTVEEYCDIDLMIRAAESTGKMIEDKNPVPENDLYGKTYTGSTSDHKVKLAVARDEAFCFYYGQNLKLMERSGVKIDYFSPIHDKTIPDGVSGILLGGGYPELHLKELASNDTMLRSIRDAIDSGMPSLAECGGFMYLHDAIEGPDKKVYNMVGMIDGVCRYTGHLVDFGYAGIAGYRNAPPKAGRSDDFIRSLCGMRGHEFHYYDSSSEEKDMVLEKASTGLRYDGMIAGDCSLWGFLHLYYPSKPEAVRAFVEGMKRYGKRYDFFCK